MRKSIYYISIIMVVLVSCTQTKIIYGKHYVELQKIKNQDNFRTILLMDLFMNNEVKVIQNDSVIFNNIVVSSYGKGPEVRINKNFDVKIYVDNNSPIIIKKEKLKEYMFTYIYTYRDKQYAELTDFVALSNYNPFFKYHSEKDVKCKIMAIDSLHDMDYTIYYVVFKEEKLFSNGSLNMITTNKIDTVITDLPRIRVGETYNFFLNDFFTTSESLKAKVERKEYDSYRQNISEEILKKYDIAKYWDNNDLINLYYKRKK